jgi:argininosuccinate lyase
VALGFDKTEAALSTLGTVLTTLQANTGRMAEAAAANYSATTDLADALAQQTGVGYRQMYGIIGGLVDRAIGEHRPLTTLTAATITAAAAERSLPITITDAAVQAALDPSAAIARRTHIGGAAPAEMARLLAARADAQAAARAWATTRQTRIAAARTATRTQLLAVSSE